MKIAIIGSKKFDTIEYNLKESFNHNGYLTEIFDIYDSFLFKVQFAYKYAYLFDLFARKYSDSYDRKVFKNLAYSVLSYNPDLVICVYRFIHPCFVDIIKREKIKIIHINPDALTTLGYQQIFVSDYDLWFTKDPYMLSFMKNNMHLNAKLYCEAFNTRIHIKPEKEKLLCESEIGIDVMTYGTIYPYRYKMLKCLINQGVNIKVFGTKPKRFYDNSFDTVFQNKFIVGEEKSNYLYGAKIVFNQMHFAEIESVNNRFFEVNGSGAFQLSDYRPILHELLPIDPKLVSFKTVDEGVEKIKYYLSHPLERCEISKKIYSHFVENYSYDKLIEFILNEI